MYIIRTIVIHFFISLLLVCFLNFVSSTFLWGTTPPTTTTSTIRPFTRTPGLSLPRRNSYPPKCMKEVPAVMFKFEKDVEIMGNSTHKYFNLIETCCEGYKRYDFDWSRCVPDCGNKCVHNGFCLDGGYCQCFNEFVLNHRNECVPTCPLGCPNGQCFLNGTCVCNEGYELDGSKKFCMAKCEKYGCGYNEYCIEPDKCACEEGYMRAVPDLGMGCQPVCIPDCGFGLCIAPNECQCFHGYQKRINGSVCESYCNYMRCDNGICVNSFTCLCNNGYIYDNYTTSCLPDCGNECENGVCVSPGVCRCFNGYERKGKKCVAICAKSCGYYGRCIAPNICGCSLVEGPTKSFQQCGSGYCNSRGRCHCQDDQTRFVNECMLPNQVITYAAKYTRTLNRTLIEEFNLLIGQYFMFLPNEYLRQSEYAGFGIVY